jgi:hypothetical protein
MPDDLFGDPMPRRKRKKATRRACESDLRTTSRRIKDVARFEDLYRLAAVLESAPGPRPGRPPEYPPYIYVLFLALRGIHGSARYCAGDLQDKDVWKKVRRASPCTWAGTKPNACPDPAPPVTSGSTPRRSSSSHACSSSTQPLPT